MIEIFSGNVIEVEMLKGLLNDAGIEAVLKDENIGSIAPWYAAPGGVGAVKLIISEADLENAKPIVEAYIKNQESGS